MYALVAQEEALDADGDEDWRTPGHPPAAEGGATAASRGSSPPWSVWLRPSKLVPRLVVAAVGLAVCARGGSSWIRQHSRETGALFTGGRSSTIAAQHYGIKAAKHNVSALLDNISALLVKSSQVQTWKKRDFWCHAGPLPAIPEHNSSGRSELPVRILTADISYGHPLFNQSLLGFDFISFQGCDNIDSLSRITVPKDSDYFVLNTGLGTCLAYKSSRWTLLNSSLTFVGVDSLRNSTAQWIRVQDEAAGKVVMFVNVQGPSPVNSGGLCGGQALAYELAMMLRTNIGAGDAIIVTGAFNADAYSPMMVALAQRLRSAIPGTNRWVLEHVYSNLGLGCAGQVERADNDSISLTLDLGSDCSRNYSGPGGLTAIANSLAISPHDTAEAASAARPKSSTPPGPRLAVLEMSSWSCRGACPGGGCCDESDCAWSCLKDSNYSSLCKTYAWTSSSLRCMLFAEASSDQHVQPIPGPAQAPLLTFYAYRGMNDDQYELESIDAANLAGELYYLNHEVVSASCPRHYGITRIVRLKVTMRPTLEVYNSGSLHPLFVGFVTFDFGACSGPDGCSETWGRYGFNPGCQPTTWSDSGDFRYPHGVWYSFPGTCPSRKIGWKDGECRKREPGGRCPLPTGEHNCTWSLEPAGEVRLDELTGIKNYTEFCEQHSREYILETDAGIHFDFWDARKDPARCKERLRITEELFAKKYPDMPRYPDPPCSLPGMR